MKKIIFVCTGNTCRSPMAEGIFNALAEERKWQARARSAGLFVAEPVVSANSAAVMREQGIDISGHIPMQITDEIIREADLLLTMTDSHKRQLLRGGVSPDKVGTLAEFAGEAGDVPDPYGGSIEVYRSTAREIKRLLEKITCFK